MNEDASLRFGAPSAQGSSTINQINLTAQNAYLESGTKTSKITEDCLRSLCPKGARSRYRNIGYMNGTCSWVLSHGEYQRWLSKPNTLLWLEGNPGVGKSTVLKFLIEHALSASEDGRCTLSFFFNARGEKDEVKFPALLSSLLHELSGQDQRTLDAVVDRYRMNHERYGDYGKSWIWTAEELRSISLLVLNDVSLRKRTEIYIDALDEASADDADEVLLFLEDLKLNGNSTSLGVNLCITCRIYPGLKGTPDFQLQVGEYNTKDLNLYVDRHFRGLRVPPGRLKETRNLLVAQADGMFQWLVIVAPQVRSMLRDGLNDEIIQHKIRQTSGLDSLYSSLIESINDDDVSQSLKLFQWVCFAHRPLFLDEVRIILALDGHSHWNSAGEYEDQINKRWYHTSTQLVDRINALSTGLISVTQHETIHAGSSLVLHLTHQSVRDFMVPKGFQLLSKEAQHPPLTESMANLQIARFCLKYLGFLVTAGMKLTEVMWKVDMDFELCRYAIQHWRHHARIKDGEYDPQDGIVDIFESCPDLFDRWMEGCTMVLEFFDDGLDSLSLVEPVEGMTLLHICAQGGLGGPVKALLDRGDADIHRLDSRGKTPLAYAEENGWLDIKKVLLDHAKKS